MAAKIDLRLTELGIVLPPAPKPSANFLPYRQHKEIVQLSGVAPVENGSYAVVGKVGQDLSIEDGQRAAKICALNLMANLKEACQGDLDRVQYFISVRGFVNATEGFPHVPQVINGASDLIIEIFGSEIGRHARTSIGCATLPSRVAVEIDAIVIIDDTGLKSQLQEMNTDAETS